MCFDLDSLPPVPRIAGAAVSHNDIELEAADGNRFAAFEATPEEPNGIGIVILPDVRGLYRFYEELALRFAERGFDAVAIDYFGRTAGAAKRGDDFEYAPHVARAIFTVGFCFGGRNSWLAAASGHGLAGAVGFYGNPGERDGAPGPTQRAAELEAPILALQAGADQNITAEMNEAFERGLTDAGVEHELVTYEGAPHSFFDRRYEEFAEASEDAWRRVLEFLETNSA
ncbi:MAG: hypothetical protein AUH17_01065 [Actinobacteria bacterium 13_2_20CM_68_14]|nr:MAG: hypothetical protein AUH17_01065 [Actinobacteria bacterium 13_2_20CM_68_14]